MTNALLVLLLAGPASAQKLNPQSADVVQKAQAACSAAMTGATLNKQLSPAPFIQACVDDFKRSVTGRTADYVAKAGARAHVVQLDADGSQLKTRANPLMGVAKTSDGRAFSAQSQVDAITDALSQAHEAAAAVGA